jgi:hypothetical protein
VRHTNGPFVRPFPRTNPITIDSILSYLSIAILFLSDIQHSARWILTKNKVEVEEEKEKRGQFFLKIRSMKVALGRRRK